MNEIQTIWQDVLASLKKELSIVSYRNFIEPIQPISFENNEFILFVPDEDSRDFIISKYIRLIENTLSNMYGHNIFVDIKCENIHNDQPKQHANLNPDYTFEEFVQGPSNELAKTSAVAVSQNPGKVYNPLYIYGGPGLGKTHLMHAIGNTIYDKNPNANIIYISSESFTNELIQGVRTNTMAEFKDKYRNCDVLMIDDIQFISNKESTNEEMFHTFNSLHDYNKQIVISSDKPPNELKDIDERLRSRFAWGLTIDIQQPDYETRVAILQKKAEKDHMIIAPDVIAYIAEVIKSNIRELEGSLARIKAYSKLHNKDITLEMAKDAFKGIYGEANKVVITPKRIKDVVCEVMNVSEKDLIGPKRNREISYPRQIAMYLVREMTELSYPDIGKEFGGKDHTTILHAVKQIDKKINEDPTTKILVNDFKTMILQ